MFADTMNYEADLFDGTTALAASAPVSLRRAWRTTWRHHMLNIRQALKRVSRFGDVEQAASDTDLRFCILHFKKSLQNVIDERNQQKKKHTTSHAPVLQQIQRERGLKPLDLFARI